MKRLAALALVLLAACSTTITDITPAHSDDGVRGAMNGFMEALNALDAEAMASYFADDITGFVPIAQPQRADGKAAMTAIFREFAAQTKVTTPRLHLVPENMVVESSGDFGVVSFEMRTPAMVNRRTFVFRRTDGKWLIVHMHASNSPIK